LIIPTPGSMWKTASMFLRDELGDHPGGHLGGEVLDVVELVATHQRVEQVGADVADVLVELRHAPGGEGAGDERAQDGVRWRVHEDDLAGAAHVAVHELEHGAVARAEDDRVPMGGFHVGVAAQRPEAVAVVAVERRLVAQPTPHRMRIVVEPFVERVPVQLGRGRHLGPPGCGPRPVGPRHRSRCSCPRDRRHRKPAPVTRDERNVYSIPSPCTPDRASEEGTQQ
jgi:hypothetical protein